MHDEAHTKIPASEREELVCDSEDLPEDEDDYDYEDDQKMMNDSSV